MPQLVETLGSMIDRLTERVGNNTVYWGVEEKTDAINEALCVWQCLTGEWTDGVTFPAIAGQAFYQVPFQLTGIQRVRWYPPQSADRLSGAVILVETSLPEMDNAFGDWESTPGTPSLWIWNGINEFALYPQPTNGFIVLDGMTDAPRTESLADVIEIEAESVVPVIAYGHYYLTQKEGGAEMQAGLEGLKEFIKSAADRNGKLDKMAFYLRWMGFPREDGLRPARGDGQRVGARS